VWKELVAVGPDAEADRAWTAGGSGGGRGFRLQEIEVVDADPHPCYRCVPIYEYLVPIYTTLHAVRMAPIYLVPT